MTTFPDVRNHLCKADPSITSFINIINDPIFYLQDINGLINKLNNPEFPDLCFKVSMKTSQNIGVVPIDGNGGYIGFGISCCDSIIFSKACFCFLEFKLNATSLKPKAIKKNRKKAIKQLGKTVNRFNTILSNDYLDLAVEAHISTPPTYPRADTKWQSYRIEFLVMHGIPLFESNGKEFS
jgi:hypothetical protein